MSGGGGVCPVFFCPGGIMSGWFLSGVVFVREGLCPGGGGGGGGGVPVCVNHRV